MLAVVPVLSRQSVTGSFFEPLAVSLHWITAPGTSQPEERRIVTRASRELCTIPGMRHFGSHRAGVRGG